MSCRRLNSQKSQPQITKPKPPQHYVTLPHKIWKKYLPWSFVTTERRVLRSTAGFLEQRKQSSQSGTFLAATDVSVTAFFPHLLCPHCGKLYHQYDKDPALCFDCRHCGYGQVISSSSYRLTTTSSNSLPEKDWLSFVLLVTALRLEKTFSGLLRRWSLNLCINLQK